MNRSVLIVDDELSICKALTRTLKRYDFTIYQATSGNAALSLLDDHPIDCIISDQRMPGMKGTDLLGIAKTQFPQASRIILSGQSDIKDMEDAINIANVAQFIGKPWDEAVLLKAVNDSMRLKPVIDEPYENGIDDHKYDFDLQCQLEADIKNNLIDIAVEPLNSILSASSEQALTLNLYWPAHPKLTHQEIITIANQAGYQDKLLISYLLQVVSYSGLSKNDALRCVVDLFDLDALSNKSTQSIIALAFKLPQSLAFRIPFLTEYCDSARQFLLDNLNSHNHSHDLILSDSIIDRDYLKCG